MSKGYGVEAVFDIKDEKKCAETCNRAWIVNFDELKSFIKADPESAKAFLTRQTDTCRLAYREEAEDYDRHCIFVGSTNDTSILKDYTGKIERRYWIMKCNQTDKRYIFDNFTDKEVDQLWAEAYHIYKHNPKYNISISDFTDKECEEMKLAQKDYKTYAEDDLVDTIKEILNEKYRLSVDGTFRDMEDFKMQILNKNSYDYKSSNLKNIDCIPFSYLNYIIQQIHHTNRPNNWLAMALEDDWVDVAKMKYGNTRVHCLKRKGSNSIMGDLFYREG